MSKVSSHMFFLENSTKKKGKIGPRLVKTVLSHNQLCVTVSSTKELHLLLFFNSVFSMSLFNKMMKFSLLIAYLTLTVNFKKISNFIDHLHLSKSYA